MARLVARLVHAVEEMERLTIQWESLAGGVPFREPLWLGAWWRHFGDAAPWYCGPPQLFLVAVESDGRLVGLAPWYLESRPLGERVLRWLGSGIVCSEYLTVLTTPGDETKIATVVGKFLCEDLDDAWDRIEFDAAAVDDPALQALFAEFVRRGVEVERRSGPCLWRVPLPGDWEQYLAMLSKSHRKQVRRLTSKVLTSDRVAWHTTRYEDEFDRDWQVLVELHGRRRNSLGDAGRFACTRFADFHREAARGLLRLGRLRLHRLEHDGRPIAVEYHFAGRDALYAYQSGIEPTALDLEPGRLATIATMRDAMSEGFSHYDLLRGDEPYKAHWRAEPTATEQVTAVAPRIANRVWNALRRQARRVRRTLRKST